MPAALLRAVLQLTDPAVRRVILLSLVATIAGIAALTTGTTALLHLVHLTGVAWLDWTLDALGTIGTLVLSWLLFPAIVAAVSSLFLDDVVAAVERRHYPHRLSTPQPMGELILVALRFLAVTVLLNLLVLPLYLIPGANIALFLALNGYLLGRQYYEQVAGRHLDPTELRRFRQAHAPHLFLAGVIICGFAAVPVLNLLAPVVATAFMVHVFHRLPAA